MAKTFDWSQHIFSSHTTTLIFRHKNLGYPPVFVVYVLHIVFVAIIDPKTVKVSVLIQFSHFIIQCATNGWSCLSNLIAVVDINGPVDTIGFVWTLWDIMVKTAQWKFCLAQMTMIVARAIKLNKKKNESSVWRMCWLNTTFTISHVPLILSNWLVTFIPMYSLFYASFGCRLFPMMHKENIASARQSLAALSIAKRENWTVKTFDNITTHKFTYLEFLVAITGAFFSKMLNSRHLVTFGGGDVRTGSYVFGSPYRPQFLNWTDCLTRM